jgi:hypothetical protein
MKTLNNIEKYTTEYDNVMNTPLEVVHGVYDSQWGEYSIKIPNELTSKTYLETFDGDQPCYSRDIENKLEELGLSADTTLADYPRHGDTLRLIFKDLDKANASLFFIKKVA